MGLWLSSCMSVKDFSWDIEFDPPTGVLTNSGPSPKMRSEQIQMANSCAVLKDVGALKLVSYDEFGDLSASGSAVAIFWQGKTVYITNQHNVSGRDSFFLVDDKENWVEMRMVKSSGNIFKKSREDTLSNSVAVDLALLEPISPMKLTVKPHLLYDGGWYSGQVAAMGYPNGEYGWTVAKATSSQHYLIVYDEDPVYSQPGTSGGGILTCDTGEIVGLTFAVPTLFFIINPRTGEFRRVKTVDDLRYGGLVAQYAIHAFQIRTFLESIKKK